MPLDTLRPNGACLRSPSVPFVVSVWAFSWAESPAPPARTHTVNSGEGIVTTGECGVGS
jgi:hypothetical protein